MDIHVIAVVGCIYSLCLAGLFYLCWKSVTPIFSQIHKIDEEKISLLLFSSDNIEPHL